MSQHVKETLFDLYVVKEEIDGEVEKELFDAYLKEIALPTLGKAVCDDILEKAMRYVANHATI